jgi:hypothetical protein
MGMEFKLRWYRLSYTNGTTKTIKCSQWQLKNIIREQKVCGYIIIKTY